MLKFFSFFKRDFGLVRSFSPLVFSDGVRFSRVRDFNFSDVSFEFLDSNLKSGELVFRKFDDVCFENDFPFYRDLDFRNFVIDVESRMFGREFSKTCGFRCDGDLVFEVLAGNGFFLIESCDGLDVKVVKVSHSDFVVVPAGFNFVLINSCDSMNFSVFGVYAKGKIFEAGVLERFSGANLFFTKSGFVKNLNLDNNYVLNNFEGDFVFDYFFDKVDGLYYEVLRIPEKFNFLKK